METKTIVFQRGTSGKVIIEEGAEVEIVFRKAKSIVVEGAQNTDVQNVQNVHFAERREFAEKLIRSLKGRNAILCYRAAVAIGCEGVLRYKEFVTKYPEACGSRNQLSYWLRDSLPKKFEAMIERYKNEILSQSAT